MSASTRQPRDGDWAVARRTAARTFHPDVGGDHHAFIAALTAIDATYGGREVPLIVVRHERRRRVTALVTGAMRRVAPKRVRYLRL